LQTRKVANFRERNFAQTCSSSDKSKNVSKGSFTVDVLPWADEVTEFIFNPDGVDR